VKFFIGKGENAKEFAVHRELVYLNSPVLKAAFESPFLEGITQEYRLEDTSEEAFLYLMQWFYSRTINFATHYDGVDWTVAAKDMSGSEDYERHLTICRKEMRTLVEFWVLADKLMIPKPQNLVMRQISEIVKPCIEGLLDQIQFIYDNTSEDSQLRRFVVYHSIWNVGKGFWDKEYEDLYPKEFLIDAAYAFSSVLSDPSRGTRCGRRKNNINEFFVPLDP